MSFEERIQAMHAAGELTEADVRDALRRYHIVIGAKVHEGLLKHFDGDLGKVTAFIQTHHLPRITSDDEAGTITVRYAPHHDDLEHLEFVIDAPEWEEPNHD